MRPAILILLTVSVLRAEPPRLDPYGDPLPEGAISRIGCSRNSEGEVQDLALTPDGRRFVVGAQSGLVVRETRTLDEVRRIPFPRSRFLHKVAISADGKRVAALVDPPLSEQDDQPHRDVVVVWDADTGAELYSASSTGTGNPALALSADGKKLAALGQVFDVDARKAVRKVAFHPKKVAFPQKTEGLLFVGGDRYLVDRRSGRWACWDVETGGEVLCETAPPRATDDFRAFTRDGRTVFFMRDADLVRQEVEYPTPDRPWVRFGRSATIPLADGVRIRAASETGDRLVLEGSLKLLNQRFVCLYDATSNTISNPVWSRLDSSAGLYAAVVTERDALVLIRPRSALGASLDFEVIELPGGKNLAEDRGLKFVEGELTWMPDGKRLRSNDQLWDARTGKYLGEAKRGDLLAERWRPPPSEDKQYSQSQHVCSGGVAVVLRSTEFFGFDGGQSHDELGVWDVAANRKVHELRGTSPGQFGRLNVRGLSLDGGVFAQDGQNQLVLWNPRTGWQLASLTFDPSSRPFDILNPLMCPSGREVVCTPPGRLMLFDIPSRTVVVDLKLDLPRDSTVLSLDRSPDGRFVAIVPFAPDAPDAPLQIYDLHRRRRVRVPTTGWIGSVRFSPDGRSILTQNGLCALIWPVPEVEPFYEPLEEDEFSAAWKRLLAPSAADCRKALLRLSASGDRAAKFLDGKLEAERGFDPERFDALLAGLRSDDFRKRATAEKELSNPDEAVVTRLQKVFDAGGLDADLSERLGRLVEAAKNAAPPAPETLRKLRGIAALESIGTGSARKTLERLARVAEESAVTRAARASLKRLE